MTIEPYVCYCSHCVELRKQQGRAAKLQKIKASSVVANALLKVLAP